MRIFGFVLFALAAPALSAGGPAAALPPSAFDYDKSLPLDVRQTVVETRGPMEIRDITFANLSGGRTEAYLVGPKDGRKCAGVLFVHWYGDVDSNRTQFLKQAVELAPKGVVSLLIATMWSTPRWFENRNPADDYDSSVRQVKELRRALDVLITEPKVDPARIAYVGHDFGAMYGAVLAGVESRRVRAWALQAGNDSFPAWFLLGRKLAGPERQAVMDRLAPLDPVLYIGAAGAPVLFQFARKDRYVTEEAANAFFAAAKDPKTILWYDASHALNAQAIEDRQRWLVERLGLK